MAQTPPWATGNAGGSGGAVSNNEEVARTRTQLAEVQTRNAALERRIVELESDATQRLALAKAEASEDEKTAAGALRQQQQGDAMLREKKEWLRQLMVENRQLQSLFQEARTAKVEMVAEMNELTLERAAIAEEKRLLMDAGPGSVRLQPKIRTSIEALKANVASVVGELFERQRLAMDALKRRHVLELEALRVGVRQLEQHYSADPDAIQGLADIYANLLPRALVAAAKGSSGGPGYG